MIKPNKIKVKRKKTNEIVNSEKVKYSKQKQINTCKTKSNHINKQKEKHCIHEAQNEQTKPKKVKMKKNERDRKKIQRKS